MKKRKYYLVIILLVISFFSLLLVSCKENDNKEKEDDEKVDPIDNHNDDNKDDNHEDDNQEELGPSEYYFLDEYDNRVDLRSDEQIDGYRNYENNIYFISKRIEGLNPGDVINICGKNAVVGLNVYNTMANCLIYVNAIPSEESATIYLDTGIINEVFHFYHDNLTIYGPYAGIEDESLRDNSLEAIFTGSVSVRGDNITIDGVAVNDLDNTIIIYGKNIILKNIVKNNNIE